MTIHLHIERVVLNGIHLTPRERAQFDAALQQELGQLISTNGLKPGLSSGAVPMLQAHDITWTGNPQNLGAQVAQAIYAEVGSNDETH